MAVPQKIKSVMMPIAMLTGIVLGSIAPHFIKALGITIPYLVSGMLLVAYSKLHFKSIKITQSHVYLLLIQMIGSLVLWKAISFWNPLLAEQVFVCLFCPVATSSPVIVGMLGGSLPSIVTYILFFYITTSFFTPLILPFISGVGSNVPFLSMSLNISMQVMPLILFPLIIVFIMKLKAKKCIKILQDNQSIAFYLWSITLILTIGKATTYVIGQPREMIPQEICLGIVSLLTCLFQFGIGRIIGIKFKDKIAATQSLGQKNVAFGMWLVFAYMNPLLSIGMATYSIFQNSINSLQIYLKANDKAKQ